MSLSSRKQRQRNILEENGRPQISEGINPQDGMTKPALLENTIPKNRAIEPILAGFSISPPRKMLTGCFLALCTTLFDTIPAVDNKDKRGMLMLSFLTTLILSEVFNGYAVNDYLDAHPGLYSEARSRAGTPECTETHYEFLWQGLNTALLDLGSSVFALYLHRNATNLLGISQPTATFAVPLAVGLLRGAYQAYKEPPAFVKAAKGALQRLSAFARSSLSQPSSPVETQRRGRDRTM